MSDATARFRHAGTAFREAATAWLTEKAGPVVEVILSCVSRLERPDAVPLGLAVGVVYHPAAAGKLERASGKLEERFLASSQPPDATVVQRWSTAATEVVRALRHTDVRAYRQTLQRADEILSEVQADGFAYLSDTSSIGFDQRLARFGHCLGGILASKAWDSLDGLIEARQAVRDHDQSARETRRLERVDMAVRLGAWLGSGASRAPRSPGPLPRLRPTICEMAGSWTGQGSACGSGDPVQVLSEAYARLFEVVTQVREDQAHTFARLLVDWTAAGSRTTAWCRSSGSWTKLSRPLAADNPVLVIVIDGMSVAVCRELLADLTQHEWSACAKPAGRSTARRSPRFPRSRSSPARACSPADCKPGVRPKSGPASRNTRPWWPAAAAAIRPCCSTRRPFRKPKMPCWRPTSARRSARHTARSSAWWSTPWTTTC